MPPHSENQKKNDPHEIEGVKSRHAHAATFPWFRVSVLVLFCGSIVLLFSPLSENLYRKLRELRSAGKEVKEKKSRESKPKAPLSPAKPKEPVIRAPKDHTASSGGDMRMLSRGLQLNTNIRIEKGGAASLERDTD